ncbi:MAG: preprotein translocase subunit SecA [Candidatus Magasanikbacteria bacterium]|nr:preprotein translocase subunit SecA [Candidatus Magasanikbacteria bacterium]
MSFLTKIFGDPNAKVIDSLKPLVAKINSLEPLIQVLSDAALKNKTQEFKDRLKQGGALDDLLPEAFAVVREASRRVTGMRHFDVQLIGGIALHRGNIAEMRTGEGKTLVATLPIYLNALTGKGVHLVTVNDYLAKRDAVWMGQIYDFLGLSVGIIQNLLVSYKYTAIAPVADAVVPAASVIPTSQEESSHQLQTDRDSRLRGNDNVSEDNSSQENGKTININEAEEAKLKFKVEYDHLEKCSRQDAYQCDIVYGTNNEFGFDYLRDNMVGSLSEMSQRPLNFAIVDEVDSILIDEARTPLIISAPAEKAADMYYKFAQMVEKLAENEDYNTDEKMRAASLSEAGIKKLEGWLGISNIYAEGGLTTVHHVEAALRAKAIFKRDRDYVVENGEVLIVDEFTGRKMPGRRYSEGLHQAIEAKEGVAIQRESQTMATITFQNYFRMYQKLSGMTGTAVTEAEEFGKIYKLEVVVVPTNRENKRVDRSDRIYKTEEAKYKAIAGEVRKLQEQGQPVLIGTISVDKNEMLSNYLSQEGIKHEILNAKNHEREGEIIAQAGRPGAVTLATNMAGRGVDIIMGGNPPDLALADQSKQAGGLFVIGTERHESRRIDNQLRGRAGRQGDPGATQFYLSTEDDLMRIFAGERIKRVMSALRVPDDMPIENKSLSKIIASAQKKVEGFHFDTRKHLLEYDDVINRHREVIYTKRRAVLTSLAHEQALAEGKPSPISEIPGQTLRQMIWEMIENEIEQLVSFHTNGEDKSEWNTKEITESVVTIFPLTDTEKNKLVEYSQTGADKLEAVVARTNLIEYLTALSHTKYNELLVTKSPHPALMFEIEKQMLLRAIDTLWIEHLVAIDYLRTGIGLRGYGQRDPLVEYKKETFRMFNELLALIQKDVVYSIFKVGIGLQLAPSVMQQSGNLILKGADDAAKSDFGFGTGGDGGAKVIYESSKPKDASGQVIGRNDPCYCGSGKKYKRCHGLNG